MKFNATLIRTTVVAVLGGLLFGFDTAIISGTQTHLKKVFKLADFLQGFMVASALIGLQFFVVWKFFPETKGIAQEDMEDVMNAPVAHRI